MTFTLPNMQRALTPDQIDKYLPHCFDYVAQEFGAMDCISLDRLRDYRARGVHFYQPYGDFAFDPPRILGIVNCVLISHAELDLMKRGLRAETQLEPWRPGDGKAVLWVASVVSDKPTVAARCLAGMLDQVTKSPFKDSIDTLGVFCTGPQGYMMAQTFGCEPAGTDYREGWPFMQRSLKPGDIDELGAKLPEIWGMVKIRDVIKQQQRDWGKDWRRRVINGGKLAQ